jgi:DNA-binding NarL/FixJ family response regulator
VARALRALRGRVRAAAVAEALGSGLDATGQAVVLLDRGRVAHMSAHAARLLAGSLPPAVAGALAAGLEPPSIVQHGGRRLQLSLLRGELDVLLVRELPKPQPGLGLTPRELAVLEHVRAGLGDREVADVLRISPRTVHRHLQNSYAKLGVRSRTAALAKVFRASG